MCISLKKLLQPAALVPGVALQVKFSVDPVQVLLHGAFGKAHFQGDFPVAEAGGSKFYGLPLIVGEAGRAAELIASGFI